MGKVRHTKIVCIIALLAISQVANSQRVTPPPVSSANAAIKSESTVGTFRVNDTRMIASTEVDALCAMIDSLQHFGLLRGIVIDGYASPDGPAERNVTLARDRAAAMRNYICGSKHLPDSVFSIESHGEDWAGTRAAVEKSTTLGNYRNRILEIIDTEANLDARERALRTLGGGTVWAEMCRSIFPPLRRSSFHLLSDVKRDLAISVAKEMIATKEINADTLAKVAAIAAVATVDTIATLEIDTVLPPCTPPRTLVLRTNAVGLAMLVANVAVEYDFAPRWSVALPVYFSALNYFSQRTKFRTLAFRPEARYWFTPLECDVPRAGFFAEGHLGLAWYNFALPGSSRYQDHNGNTPAYGGGVGVGYRLPLGSGNFGLEFALGAGVYHLHYDKFSNTPNISTGYLRSTRNRTALLLDNVAVNFIYKFNLERGGRK